MSVLELETARLRLRPYAPDDAGALHALWTSPGVRRFLFDDEIIPPEFVEEEIASTTRSFADNGWGQWAAFLRETGSLAGFTGFRPFHEPPELELLFGVAEEHWGRGLAGEMAAAMIALGFERFGFDRIQGSTDAPNAASVRVMEKLGMRFLRRANSGGLDTIYYEITPGEFAAAGKAGPP
jgi:[ribosomal protein S5]-alanine N-acetyltransferase